MKNRDTFTQGELAHDDAIDLLVSRFRAYGHAGFEIGVGIFLFAVVVRHKVGAADVAAETARLERKTGQNYFLDWLRRLW